MTVVVCQRFNGGGGRPRRLLGYKGAPGVAEKTRLRVKGGKMQITKKNTVRRQKVV